MVEHLKAQSTQPTSNTLGARLNAQLKVIPLQRYTCPMHCMLEGLDLTYEEDGWPSIPKITDFFADSPMDKDQIGKW